MNGLVQQAPVWSVLVAVPLLLCAAVVAGSLDAVLDPRGPMPLRARVLRPLSEVSRSLLAQRGSTVASDRLLWAIGVATPLLVAVMMAPVVPLGSAVVSDLVWPERLRLLLRQSAQAQFNMFIDFVRDSTAGNLPRAQMEHANLALARAAVRLEDMRAGIRTVNGMEISV